MLLPVEYNGIERQNPDGSFYPGDGYHYLFLYDGLDTCLSVGVKPLESEGATNVLSHNIAHEDYKIVVKMLTTTHFTKILASDQKCTVQRGGLRTCDAPTYTLGGTVFSFREDVELTKSMNEKISQYSKQSGKYLKTFTEAWGITRILDEHSHEKDFHKFEDSSSIASLEKIINNSCSSLGKYQGCVYGHVEIESEIIHQMCLLEELDKMNIRDHSITQDECIKIQNSVLLTVQGVGKKCQYDGFGNKICKTTIVKATSSGKGNILFTRF